jgi:hypothetical protein
VTLLNPGGIVLACHAHRDRLNEEGNIAPAEK